MEFDPVTADANTRRNLAIRHPVLSDMRDSPLSRRNNIVVGPPSSSLLTCPEGILALGRVNFPPPAHDGRERPLLAEGEADAGANDRLPRRSSWRAPIAGAGQYPHAQKRIGNAQAIGQTRPDRRMASQDAWHSFPRRDSVSSSLPTEGSKSNRVTAGYDIRTVRSTQRGTIGLEETARTEGA